MARRKDPRIEDHLEWIGFVRPTGLVVAAPALVRAGAILNRHDREGQERLRDAASELEGADDNVHLLSDFEDFARVVLEWSFSPKGYAGTDEAPIPDELIAHLPDFGETIRPDLAVRERSPADGESSWQLLVRVLESGSGPDDPEHVLGSTLDASPHGRMERLLRLTGVPAGLLFNGATIRLISAPTGESSGWLDFNVEDMVQTAGRPICAAMRLLLSERRLLALPKQERLAALLDDSRKFQNEVSEKLAEQVLHALYELLRGMQAAHDQSKGSLLREVLAEDPDEVYRALLTVLLRIVFLLYAEERDMLPSDDVYARHYSIASLHDRLREDAAQFPDTLDQRYGAWAQLVGLFRMIYDGADLGSSSIPQRHGVLFDPDRFPFLEGRSSAGTRQVGTRIDPPLVPDGTVYRTLENLLVLEGERISYRALDVEQIGSVYETMMGFRLETASGRSLAVRSKSRYGAPTAIDLDALLEVSAGKRRKWLQDRADRKVSASVNRDLKEAGSIDELHAALRPVVDAAATPDLVPPRAMVLQPSEERRRSGSHYTPRSLTQPIVEKTLEPILARLRQEAGGTPTPDQILDLKICDPAMGSGAFLVETCRQLGEALLDAWKAHGSMPTLPADEDERVAARRLVAQRCIYGVDRNPIAVDLAKVSLWLATLARDHAFTFLDHALRHGDSLVGLSRKRIERFHWDAESGDDQAGFESMRVEEHMERVHELRRKIRSAGEDVSDWELRDLWDEADHEQAQVRLFGHLVVVAYFEGSTRTEREARRAEYAQDVVAGSAPKHRNRLKEMMSAHPPLIPFHWEVEFPEVFDRDYRGFDAFVGNPPFMGGKRISSTNGKAYSQWLVQESPGASGSADLVAHFFRQSFVRLRSEGTMGFIATNTIGQGDTRATGLEVIRRAGGSIYAAWRRVVWPGSAAVIVSIVHVSKSKFAGRPSLDGSRVKKITPYLFSRGPDTAPARLQQNLNLAFVGYQLSGIGFTFDDSNPACASLSDRSRILTEEPDSRQHIYPYIGGSELYTSPKQAHHRYAINFGQLTESEARKWPLLMEIVEERVRPFRETVNRARHREKWWQYGEPRPGLADAVSQLDRVVVKTRTSDTFAFVFMPADVVFAESTVVLSLDSWSAFAVVQARPHEIWARFFGTTLKDDLVYGNRVCFETFPFPERWQNQSCLEPLGMSYHEYRANLMVDSGEGLTQIYNRFHDPNECDPAIMRLRELHAEMDRAVLDAYGWEDIPIDCEFLLDYEIDEENWNPRKKKPWRYRWPDEVHDEVLARLLELNEEYAEAEKMGRTPTRSHSKGESASPSASSHNHDLFPE